jgi:hypothetical protein
MTVTAIGWQGAGSTAADLVPAGCHGPLTGLVLLLEMSHGPGWGRDLGPLWGLRWGGVTVTGNLVALNVAKWIIA